MVVAFCQDKRRSTLPDGGEDVFQDLDEGETGSGITAPARA
jgi:hypothetical protein